MGEIPRQPIYDSQGRVENPNIAHDMAKIEDPYHKRRLGGLIRGSEEKIKEGERAAAEAGHEIQKQVEAEEIESLLRDSAYAAFFDNVYKYPDRFTVPGQTSEQVAQTFGKAYAMLEALRRVIESKSTVYDNPNYSSFEKGDQLISEAGIIYDSQKKAIDINKACEFFRWSLETFVKGGDKIGRKPDIEPGKIGAMVDSLNNILDKINNSIK